MNKGMALKAKNCHINRHADSPSVALSRIWATTPSHPTRGGTFTSVKAVAEQRLLGMLEMAVWKRLQITYINYWLVPTSRSNRHEQFKRNLSWLQWYMDRRGMTQCVSCIRSMIEWKLLRMHSH